MKDVVDDALSALREEGALDPQRKAAMRDRLLTSSTKRLRVGRWLLPMVAVFGVASAWAAATHSRWHEPSASTPPDLGGAQPTIMTAAKPIETAPAAESSTAAVPSAVTAVASSSEAPVDSPQPRSTQRRVAAAHDSAAAAPSSPPNAPSDAERRALLAYRDAERLQFSESNYAGALAAWDRFLPLAGSSPLAFDARYDRALCLFHLGRIEEARRALAPFANAAPGAYRQAEARALLDSLQ